MTLKTTKLRDAISFALVAGATVFAGTGVALAQESNTETGSSPSSLDRVTVTGSRIKRADIEGALPIVVLDRAQIEASGDISVADFLRDTTFNSFGSYQTTSGSSWGGASGVSLRGLGEGRTLILIDGRRAPTAPMSGSFQDLNSIPMAAVERIEVLSDGASAVYGSDALAGVVNIITRKDFEGAEITYGVGRPSLPGGDTQEASILIGASGERGRVLGGASYNKRDIIFTRDRDYWYSTPGGSVYSNNFALSRSTAASQRLTHPVFGTAVPGLCTNGDDSDLFWQAPNLTCQFNHSATSADLTSTENKSLFLHGDYQINDDWMFYFAGSVTKTEAFGRYAPVPSSPWPGGAIILEAGTPNHPGTIGGNNPHAADPYYQSLVGQDLFLFHRFAALGNRDGRVENTTSSFLGGFEGRIGKVDIDVGARHVESRATDIGQNYVVGGLAQQHITSGNYNIYDPFEGDANALGFTATILRDMKTTTKEFYGSASFDLFDMGGGAAAAVIGAEYREEYYQDNYDPLSESGQIVGSAGSSSSGSREVYAAYFEALFPILDNFEVNVAGRFDRYNDYGSDFAPKVSLRWQPIDSLTLRASYGEGFRAPSLDILSALPSFSAAFVTDRQTCIMLTGSAACEIQTNTYQIVQEGLQSEQSKQFGIGAVWDATDWLNLTLDYYDIEIENSLQFVGIQTIADCLRGAGSVCPEGLSQFAAGTILPNPALGLGAQFDPTTGGIVNGQTGTTNIGWVETNGFDFTARTNFDLGGAGSLRNMLSIGYVGHYSSNGDPSVAGRPGYPRIRAALSNNWSYGDWDFIWNLSYIHRTQSTAFRNWRATLLNVPDPADYADPADYQDAVDDRADDLDYYSSFPTHLSSYLTQDLQVNYRAPWNATITIGVKNVGNRNPVYDRSTGGTSYDSYLYDPWGRVPYVRYTQRF